MTVATSLAVSPGRLAARAALTAALVDEPDAIVANLWGLPPDEMLRACTELVGLARAAVRQLDAGWWPRLAVALAGDASDA